MCNLKLYSYGDNYKLYQGNMLDMLDVIEPNSIDAIVTDPPYELNFMNKNWDNSGIAFQKEAWKKCLKVLKPGGYLLAFGGSRTHHRIMCAIEDAGFEIRDMICWIFGAGFPKSMNIGLAIDKKTGIESTVIGQSDFPDIRNSNYENNDGTRIVVQQKQAQNKWEGWGTQLKPAYESITVARKPCEGSCVDNVLKYGVGGINIDECRVPHSEPVETMHRHTDKGNNVTMRTFSDAETDCIASPNAQGRFPANVILTYDETDQEEVCGGMPYTKSTGGSGETSKRSTLGNFEGGWKHEKDCVHLGGLGDEGSAARYFYCAKASKRDRDEGLPEGEHNIHPTVKNTMLMQYLVRLVTPKGGTILDPFNGSGSTGKAAMYENKDRNAGYKYIGIELTPEYLPIADARIRFALGDNTPVEYSAMVSNKTTLKSGKSSGQISLFDENT